MQKLPLFDRKAQLTVAFGEFAETVNERSESTNTAEEVYVGLDDLGSQNLLIRHRAKGSDVIGTNFPLEQPHLWTPSSLPAEAFGGGDGRHPFGSRDRPT